MAFPTLSSGITVLWVIPSEVTSALYDTVDVYYSNDESQNYRHLKTITPLFTAGVPVTFYIDAAHNISQKDAFFYQVVFSNSTTSLVTQAYPAYKGLTPRERRMVYQLRDMLSRFIANRLADEELRQYLDYGIKFFNAYSPLTEFNSINLPTEAESLIILSAAVYGMLHNFLGIGFSDISLTDQGISLNTSRMDKMGQVFDRILKMYNEIVDIYKKNYMESGGTIGTVLLPIGIGGKIGPVLQLFNIATGMGR